MEPIVYNSLVSPQWAHMEYIWKLEKFWELRALASIEALDDLSGIALLSPVFGDVMRGFWRLKVYPYGDTTLIGKGHVSVFLTLDSITKKDFYAIFSCSVLDGNGEKVEHGPAYARQKFTTVNSSWGWSKFVSVVDTNVLSCIAKDTLVIRCNLDVFLGAREVSSYLPNGSTFKSDLREYFTTPESHDIQIVCQSETIKTQEALLASRSSKFRTLINHYRLDAGKKKSCSDNLTQPSVTGEITLCLEMTSDAMNSSSDKTERVWYDPAEEMTSIIILRNDITSMAIKQMLQYMLHDVCDAFEIPSTQLPVILDLLYASWVYDVRTLYSECVTALLSCVNTEDAASEILKVAKKVNCELLENKCKTFLSHASARVFHRAELDNILHQCSEVQPDLEKPVT